MSCSKCYKELRYESNIHVRCDGCGDRFHPACLIPDDLNSYFKATRERNHWYCRDCADDSDSIRQELKTVWGKSQGGVKHRPPKLAKMDEAAQALEVLDSLMKTVDERGGSLIDKTRGTKGNKMEVEEEKKCEMEAEEEEEEEEEEPKAEKKDEEELMMDPGNDVDFAAMLALF